MLIGNKPFEPGKRTYIMGILNVTPDSFSDGGCYTSMAEALHHAGEMAEEGADILDIGGESTRPGHVAVTLEEEISRVIHIIKAIRCEIDIPISIDTCKAEVAEEAIIAGAAMINDVWGFRKDPAMAAVAAKYDVACCLMHNQDKPVYNDLIEDIKTALKDSVEIALKKGVKKDKIILDPGVGFGKTYEQNLEVMRNLQYFKQIGFPLLLGTSRKSMVGNALELPVDQRVEGTLATSVIGISKGVDFVRVHDVKENIRACRMADVIYRSCMD
ncbi:MAG: dihydropteroate synthase [Ruminiclostridium sp.]|nr:dihydropteroate synthase [Ruminiclostridium sp.]